MSSGTKKGNKVTLWISILIIVVLVFVLTSIVMNRVLGPSGPSETAETVPPESKIHPPVEETPKPYYKAIEEKADTVSELGIVMTSTIITYADDNNTVDNSDEEQPDLMISEEEAANIPVPECNALSFEELYTPEMMAELRESDYAQYLAALPWLSTKAENMWIDNEVHENDGADWLPGLNVSSLHKEMFDHIPDDMTQEEFKHVICMIGCEGGNAEDDELLCYTGDVLMNRCLHNEYFINNYGGSIDRNLCAVGQYNSWYTEESCYQHVMNYPEEVRDRIVRAAYLVANGYVDMPDTVVFQAEFNQSSGCWKCIHISTSWGFQSTEYFCFTLGVSHE